MYNIDIPSTSLLQFEIYALIFTLFIVGIYMIYLATRFKRNLNDDFGMIYSGIFGCLLIVGGIYIILFLFNIFRISVVSTN